MDDKKEKEIITPEVVEKDAGVPQKHMDKPLAETIFPFSIIPFYSKLRERAVKAWRSLVREEAGLADDLIHREKSMDGLRDVDTDIKKERLQRKSELQEAETRLQDVQREAKFSAKQDRIAELELKAKEAELEKRIQELKEPPEKPKKKSDEDKLAEKARKAAYAVREQIVEREATHAAKEEAIKRYEQQIKQLQEDPNLSDQEKEEKVKDLERLIISIKGRT